MMFYCFPNGARGCLHFDSNSRPIGGEYVINIGQYSSQDLGLSVLSVIYIVF